MFINIKNTLTEEEREGKIISSSLKYDEITSEINNILEKSNYKDVLPIIQNEKNRFAFDSILTKYINASFHKSISITERKEKIKEIIKGIFKLTEKDFIWENKGQLRILQYGIKKSK